jgi:Raf kinase inhibitor-like YbhB/YbcL family protein
MIAPVYRCPPGGNVSPPLTWTPGTRSYAVTLAHASSLHWQLWDVPPEVTSLPRDVAKAAMPPVPAGTTQSQGKLEGVDLFGYIGPCPQSATLSTYPFTVYALDVARLPVTAQTPTAAVLAALKAAALGTAVLIVTARK